MFANNPIKNNTETIGFFVTITKIAQNIASIANISNC